MSLAAIFAIICGVFVAVVLGLVVVLIVRGLSKEAGHKAEQAESRRKKVWLTAGVRTSASLPCGQG